MIFFDTLRVAECSICLQTLLPDGRGSCGSPSPRNTPHKHNPLSSQGLTRLQRDTDGTGGVEERENEFRITFARGVLPLSDENDIGDPGITRTFVSALEEYHLEKRSLGKNKIAMDGDHMITGNQGIVVLPCGHMLHFPCAVQLYEYRNDAKCPICRQQIKGASDFLLLSPAQRPTLVQHNATTNHSNNKNSNDGNGGSDDSADGVQFAGERHVAAVDAYSDRLQRETLEIRRRCRNLRNREEELASSKQQLEEQWRVLQKSEGEFRRRCEVLTNQGSVGKERLAQLQGVASETHASLKLLTNELAKLTRERVLLDRQIEKYSQKLQRCRVVQRGDVVNEELDAIHENAPLVTFRKRRLESPESGEAQSYYT